MQYQIALQQNEIVIALGGANGGRPHHRKWRSISRFKRMKMISMIQQKNKSKNGIAYYKTGKGPAVILIHGLGLRSESWVEQIKILKKNYTIYSLDLPGHGQSKLFSK